MTNKGASQNPLNGVDSEIAELISEDLKRQNTHIHLIASENFAMRIYSFELYIVNSAYRISL